MASNTEIAQILIEALKANPDLVETFLEHPYTAVQEATGAEEKLDKQDMSEVVTTAAGLASGQDFDMSNIGSLASAFLGASDNSVHSLVGSLFGGQTATTQQAAPVQQQTQQTQQQSSGLDLGTLVSFAGIASQLMGGSSNSSSGGIDLSDGIGLDDIVGLMGMTSGTTTQQTQQTYQQQTTQQDSSGSFLSSIISAILSLFTGR